jgi:DNA anti-recombination protein RmuC
MLEKRLKEELNKLSQSQLGQVFREQLKNYEVKVKDVVKDLNSKSKEAREKGRKQLEKLTVQLNTSRTGLEKKVLQLVNQETKKLNKSCQELFNYIEKLTEEKSEVRENLKATSRQTVKSVKTMASKGKTNLKKKVNQVIAKNPRPEITLQ